MNYLHYSLLFLTFSCVGCQSTRVMQVRDTSSDITRFDVQSPEKLSSSSIYFKKGTILNVDSLLIDRDSVLWIESGMVRSVSVDSVDRIIWTSRGKGGLDGLGLGLALGATGGMLLGAIVDNSDYDDPIPGYLVGAIVGATSCGLFGFAAGVVSGHTYTLTFERTQ
jgi:hypothetical protein